MGFEAPGQQCLSYWEMESTTVDGRLLVGVSSNLGGNIFSLEQLGIGSQTDSQTPTSFASSKPVFLQMSCKPDDNELANEENKQFDPGGKGGSHRFEQRMYWYSFLFLGIHGLECLACFLCFCPPACFVLFLFLLQENQMMITFLRAEANREGEKKTNGDANHVNEEYNQRASMLLPINLLKTSTSRFDSFATR